LGLEKVSGEIREAARNLRENRYTGTSELIITLLEKLEKQGNQEAQVLEQGIGPLFEVFEDEFATSCPIGQRYRRRCFGEVAIIVLKAFNLEKNANGRLSVEIKSFMDHMHEVKQSIGATMDHYMSLYSKRDRSDQESSIMFHLATQSYLTTVEGVFGELAKTLYWFIQILRGDETKSEDLQDANVWAILRGCKQIFGFHPIFLENWQEKNDIRNAIAHAQARYSSKEDKCHFWSTDRTSKRIYDRTMSFEEFLAVQLELMDAIDSFYYAIDLTRVMKLLALLYAMGSSGDGAE
jgi:hypothetical protein